MSAEAQMRNINGGTEVTFPDGTKVTKVDDKITIEGPMVRQPSRQYEKTGPKSISSKPISTLRPLLPEAMLRDDAYRVDKAWREGLQFEGYEYEEATGDPKRNYEIACRILYDEEECEPEHVAAVIVSTDRKIKKGKETGYLNRQDLADTVRELAIKIAEHYPDEWKKLNPDYEPGEYYQYLSI